MHAIPDPTRIDSDDGSGSAAAAAHPLQVPIPSPAAPAPDEVGAKAHSLQRLATAGLPVPPAVVLTTTFFAPWISALRNTAAWQALQDAEQSRWPSLSAELADLVPALEWSPAQRDALDRLGQYCGGDPARRFAVRSSSPDEDLAAASFAGLYLSLMGVPAAALEKAIRQCFASCLDVRVLVYKAARGLPVFAPAIAVIVQQQVDSDVAGVGFSINPVNNDYDEVLIDASWGLGESVVAGSAAADQFVVEKASGELRSSTLGAKRVVLELAPEGGVRTSATARAEGPCLTPAQVREVTAALGRIEQLYGLPIDMEFAYAGGTLQVLQARPVTAWVPLAPEMQTAPGARRRLYMDVALSKGMTINAPISPLGQDWLRHTVSQLLDHCVGKVDFALDRPDGLMFIGAGRMYMNLSAMLWMASPRQLAKSNAANDQLMAATLAAIDPAVYRTARRPPFLLPLLRLTPRLLWRLRRPAGRALQAFFAPRRAHDRYLERERACNAALTAPPASGLPLSEFQRRYGAPAMAAVIDVAMPAMAVGLTAMGAIGRLARRRFPEEQALAEQLTRGIGGNLVVEMGIAQFRMAQLLAPERFADLDALVADIAARRVPASFLNEWDRFMATYGHRGPGEMDLANPGYREAPVLVLRQMSFMAGAAPARDPGAAHQALARQRALAYEELLRRFGPVRRALLRRLYLLVELFAGTRDTAKHFNMQFQGALRSRALEIGRELAARGRLDRPEDVFGLRYADMDAAMRDERLDLRRLRDGHGGFLDVLKQQVRAFPAVIDSRGRILRAPVPDSVPGLLAGMPVSPGIARGPVKRLHNPHDLPIVAGDILVAFTTDPGWTPLFVNAAAVVLEVGGVLQHGALVAREYGKPCVVGISDVLARLDDGQWVEVDGAAGTVRVLDAAQADKYDGRTGQ